MPVDAASLAAALGVDAETAERLIGLAGPLVDAYLRGGEAPEAIRDEAVIRTSGHLLPRRFGTEDGGVLKAGGVQVKMAPVGVAAVRQSGAGALLAPWVRRTA